MSKKIDPVIHFEIPAEDTARLGEFYESVFGWQTQSLGAETGGFVLAFTGDIDKKTRMPKERGFINGGFYKKAKPGQGVKLTILVDDIKDAMKKVRAAGGKILGEPFEQPGVGLFVDFTDTEGNIVTLNQDYTLKHL
jgi:predicted enzyme related to lactoylglutathione lyase